MKSSAACKAFREASPTLLLNVHHQTNRTAAAAAGSVFKVILKITPWTLLGNIIKLVTVYSMQVKYRVSSVRCSVINQTSCCSSVLTQDQDLDLLSPPDQRLHLDSGTFQSGGRTEETRAEADRRHTWSHRRFTSCLYFLFVWLPSADECPRSFSLDALQPAGSERANRRTQNKETWFMCFSDHRKLKTFKKLIFNFNIQTNHNSGEGATQWISDTQLKARSFFYIYHFNIKF